MLYDIPQTAAIRAFRGLILRLRLAVVNKSKDQVPVLQLGRGTLEVAVLAGLLLVAQLGGGAGPADEVEEHGQVGEGRRQERLGVEELYCQVEASVPREMEEISLRRLSGTHFHWVSMLS